MTSSSIVKSPTRNAPVRRKWKKEKKYVKDKDIVAVDGNDEDIVIAVMGPTGVGKSTFINTLLGTTDMVVGHGLKSCTAGVQYAIVKEPVPPGKGRVIILDTPGFDDTYVDDGEILRRISVWLATSYVKVMGLAGVLYLADITQTRMLGSVRENIEMMKDLCGRDELKSVVCVTTKWSDPKDPSEEEREIYLKSKSFKELMDSGAVMMRFNKEQESAKEIVDYVLRSHNVIGHRGLCLQRELVDQSKYIPETSAGQRLRITIAEYLRKQKDDASPGRVTKSEKAMNSLRKPSIMDKIKELFGIW